MEAKIAQAQAEEGEDGPSFNCQLREKRVVNGELQHAWGYAGSRYLR